MARLDITRKHKFNVNEEFKKIHKDILRERQMLGFKVRLNESVGARITRLQRDISAAESQAIPAYRKMMLRRIDSEINDIERSLNLLVRKGIATPGERKVFFKDEVVRLEKIRKIVDSKLGR